MRLSPAAERALLAYSSPGNVRELEHVVSRAALRLLSRGASRSEILTRSPSCWIWTAMSRARKRQRRPSSLWQSTRYRRCARRWTAAQRRAIVYAPRLPARTGAGRAAAGCRPEQPRKLARRLKLA